MLLENITFGVLHNFLSWNSKIQKFVFRAYINEDTFTCHLLFSVAWNEAGYVISGTHNGRGARHHYFAKSAMSVNRGGGDDDIIIKWWTSFQKNTCPHSYNNKNILLLVLFLNFLVLLEIWSCSVIPISPLWNYINQWNRGREWWVWSWKR